jgi:tRNA threonylcarbamoyladenosine biosynthesis protein TsaB
MVNKQLQPLILNIETSTNVCSVSLTKETGTVIASRENLEDKSHSALVAVFIDEIMKESGASFDDLSAVSVSMGPGSYTGLRIGVSTAKGICYARSIPLIAMNTLDIMTNGFLRSNGNLLTENQNNVILCPMIDARRMEVYMALYNSSGIRIKETSAEIIDESSFSELLRENTLYLFGNGAAKFKNIISHTNAKFIDAIYPSAKEMGKLSFELFQQEKFVDLAYFEPFYLKDFVTTLPKK